jgi:hypothetical protein
MRPNGGVLFGPHGVPLVRLCDSVVLDRQGKEMKCKQPLRSRAPPMQCRPLP